ncbi:hypothetical protein RSOL_159430, partial [Rhizoctonia solani AG-3 Rhs1AP]
MWSGEKEEAHSDFEPGADPDDESYSEESTKVDLIPPENTAPTSSEPHEPAVGPIVVLNKDKASPDVIAKYLPLDAYDFFRLCAQAPDQRIPEQDWEIRVNPKSLRDAIVASLRNMHRAGGMKRACKRLPGPGHLEGKDGSASNSPTTKRQRTGTNHAAM